MDKPTVRNLVILLISTLVLQTSGCSYRGVYDSLQANQRQQCEKLPQPEYEDCIERVNGDYETYKRQREEVVNES